MDEISLRKGHKGYATILTDLTDAARPEILARGARLCLDDPRMGAAILGRRDHPAKRHRRDRVAGGGEQALDLLSLRIAECGAHHRPAPRQSRPSIADVDRKF